MEAVEGNDGDDYLDKGIYFLWLFQDVGCLFYGDKKLDSNKDLKLFTTTVPECWLTQRGLPIPQPTKAELTGH